MSVKKSLLAVIAVSIAIGLLFTACPTESGSSSEGGPTYSQSELWKKVSEAQVFLLSIPVSATGNDIAETQSYVTPVQKNSFAKAIADARTLAEAGVTGTEEEAALAALTKARADFQATTTSQKGKAIPASASDLDNQTLGGTADAPVNKFVAEDVAVTTGALVVGAYTEVSVGAGATLKTSGSGALNITEATAKVNVKSGGTLDVGVASTAAFAGQVVLESGAVSIDRNPGGGLLFASGGTGSFVINAGAVAILGPEGSSKVFVGPSVGDNKGQVVQLEAGVLKINANGKYELDGVATLVGMQGLYDLNIASGSTLTVSGGDLIFYAEGDDILTSGTGARIVLTNAQSTISVRNSSNNPPTGTTSGITWKDFARDGQAGKHLEGPLTLEYNGTAWVKK